MLKGVRCRRWVGKFKSGQMSKVEQVCSYGVWGSGGGKIWETLRMSKWSILMNVEGEIWLGEGTEMPNVMAMLLILAP